MTIDELLTWAFVHELPKGGGVEGLSNIHSAWSVISGLGVRVDRGSSGPAMAHDHTNFMLEQGVPHDDALAVGEAVTDLANYDIVVPEGWQPLCDWPLDDDRMAGLVAAATAHAMDTFYLRPPDQRAAHLVSLVIGTAILGREPMWDAPVSAIRMAERGGRPAWFVKRTLRDPLSGLDYEAEVDGFNQRNCRPVRGAYRKFELSDNPRGDILARLDRELWAVALETLEKALANRLCDHRLLKTDVERAPWGHRGQRIQLLARQGIEAKKTA